MNLCSGTTTLVKNVLYIQRVVPSAGIYMLSKKGNSRSFSKVLHFRFINYSHYVYVYQNCCQLVFAIIVILVYN